MTDVLSVECFATEEGLHQGLEQGRERGRTFGVRAGLLEGLESMSELRFGAAGLALLAEIRATCDAASVSRLTKTIKNVAIVDEQRQMIPQ